MSTLVAIDEDGVEHTLEDGFRPRKVRPKGWRKQAIKDGVIADPDNPIEDNPNPSGVVVRPPVATLKGE